MKLEDKQELIDILVKRIKSLDGFGSGDKEVGLTIAELIKALMEVIKYKTPEETF